MTKNKDWIVPALRLDIKNELSKITELNSPKVWAIIHLPSGKLNVNAYNLLEQKIINMILANNIPAGAIIPLIESEAE